MQPHLAELREQGMDLYVFTMGNREENEQILAELNLDATVVYDEDYTALRMFGVNSFPQTFYVDREGRVAAGTVGWGGDSYENQFLPIVLALLAE